MSLWIQNVNLKHNVYYTHNCLWLILTLLRAHAIEESERNESRQGVPIQMEQQHADQWVRVHIDQHTYTSPSPTTGAALYALAHLGDEDELYREVDGNREDELVPKGEEHFHLREDEHFHSAKHRERAFNIIVNGEPMVVRKRVLTFDEITKLAFPGLPTGPQIVFTVTFKKAAGPVHQGTLLPGGSVKIKNGTIFNVTRTDKS
jgi:hypothetical protein